MVIKGESTDISLEPVTYKTASTPIVDSISPRIGDALTPTTVTITGSNLGRSTVRLAGKECDVQAFTDTEIQCLTNPSSDVYEDELSVYVNVENLGIALTRDVTYSAVQLWSNPLTWSNGQLPAEGESVTIPKGTSIVFDVDSTPVLDTVTIEGSLYFVSNANSEHVRTFDAHNIIINGGYMEVGTEAEPYTSKLTFTLHGTPDSPKLPLYGSKTLAVSYGQL